MIDTYIDDEGNTFTDSELDEFSPYDVSTLQEEPVKPKKWLVEGIVPEGVIMLYGPSSAGKSFLALDWAFAVGTGQPWLDKYPVREGSVLYISAEDDAKHRAKACLQKYRGHTPKVSVLPRAVQFTDVRAVKTLKKEMSNLSLRPSLIVIDTLNRCMASQDENSQKDVMEFFRAVDSLRQPFNASVIIIHHTGHDKKRERGSYAMRATMDALMGLWRLKDPDPSNSENELQVPLVLESEKVRNGRPFGQVFLERVEVNLVDADQEEQILTHENRGRESAGVEPLPSLPPITSCVIRAGTTGQPGSSVGAKGKADVAFDALASLGSTGASYGEWEKASGLKGGTFTRAKDRLIQDGRVHQNGTRYVAVLSGALPLAA